MTRNSPQSRKQLIRCGSGLLLLGAVLVFPEILGATPQAQELFEPSPEDDLRLGATSRGGNLPAAMNTRSGVVSSESIKSDGLGALYGAPERRNGYRLDRFVQAPQRVEYDEPFRPSLIPYKRSVAYDFVSEDFNFSIAEPRTTEVVIGGAAQADEDSFFADLKLELIQNRAVSLPTVGPNASLRALELEPSIQVEVYQDSAENWWMVADKTIRVRALMQISVPRQVFGSETLPVGFSALKSALPELPATIRQAGLKMARVIGVAKSESPNHALRKLVKYFRAFEASTESAKAIATEEIFYELTQSQRGVCRHRAYAFALIALAIGIPARFVHNEAHAWVEVWDSKIWHRIDLGGAPAALDQMRSLQGTPAYAAPKDPYSWPKQSRPASSLAQLAVDSSKNSTTAQKDETQELAEEQGANPSGTSLEGRQTEADSRRPRRSEGISRQGQVKLSSPMSELIRGEPYILSGQATMNQKNCARVRIDITLSHQVRGAGGLMIWQSQEIGSLASDEQGKFKGQVSVPGDLEVGAYSVAGHIAGECAASEE